MTIRIIIISTLLSGCNICDKTPVWEDMNIKHALNLKGCIALLLGATVVATSCKKDQTAELQESELSQSQDSLLSQSNELTMATGSTSSGSLQFESGFEETNSILNSSWGYGGANSNSITRSTEQARSGNSSAKFVLNKSDALVNGSKRAELQFNEPLTAPNADRWFGISVFLPTSHVADKIPESIFQWHNVPNFGWGETWATAKPQNPLRLETTNGRFILVHQTSSVPSDTKSPVISKSYDLGAYKTGAWTDWVIHWKMSYKSDGILEVWKNGQVVLTLNGPNFYNDINGPYMKVGIYKWGWAMNIPNTTSQRTIYIDQFKVGNATATYNDVAPVSSTTTPTSPTPTPTEPTPTEPTPTGPVAFAVNAGGSAFTASNGITYQADKNYSGGGVYNTTHAISNTADDLLYQSERYTKDFNYSVPLSNGTYEITFKFAEKYYNASGIRQFDVLAEGREIISNLDVFKLVGHDKALDITKTVTVTDGNLNINLRRDKDLAILSAFHIKKI